MPTSAFPQPWPLRCFHCGSDDRAAVDAALESQHTTVRPQCAGCRSNNVKIVAEGRTKQCKKAPDARKKAAEEAVATAESRKKTRRPVPKRNRQYEVTAIVGKAKQGKVKKVFWRDQDTKQLCSKEECTWQPPEAFDGDSGNLDPDELVGDTITLEEGGATYSAKITKVKAPNSTSYWVVYVKIVATGKKSKKKPRWVDLELPPSEGTSSWRLDGYKTLEEDEESGEEDDDDEDEDDEDDMDVDDE